MKKMTMAGPHMMPKMGKMGAPVKPMLKLSKKIKIPTARVKA